MCQDSDTLHECHAVSLRNTLTRLYLWRVRVSLGVFADAQPSVRFPTPVGLNAWAAKRLVSLPFSILGPNRYTKPFGMDGKDPLLSGSSRPPVTMKGFYSTYHVLHVDVEGR